MTLRKPTNYNFNNNDRREFNLFTLIIDDMIRGYGTEVVYMPVEHTNIDEFFGESQTKILNESHKIKLWRDPSSGDSKSVVYDSRMAYFQDDTVLFHASKNMYNTEEIQPKVADLLYVEMEKRLYEIVHVSYSTPFLIKQDDLNYTITAKLYISNNNLTIEDKFYDTMPEISDFLDDLNDNQLEVSNAVIDRESETVVSDCSTDVRFTANKLSR